MKWDEMGYGWPPIRADTCREESASDACRRHHSSHHSMPPGGMWRQWVRHGEIPCSAPTTRCMRKAQAGRKRPRRTCALARRSTGGGKRSQDHLGDCLWL
jgi:hypothetical protein